MNLETFINNSPVKRDAHESLLLPNTQQGVKDVNCDVAFVWTMLWYFIALYVKLSCLDRKFFFRFNIHHAFFITNMYARSMHSKMFSINNAILNLLSKNILEIDWKFWLQIFGHKHELKKLLSELVLV